MKPNYEGETLDEHGQKPLPDWQYDLAVAYRINDFPTCNGPNKPPIFANDKHALAKYCLRSFKQALGDLKVKVWVILTGPCSYMDMFYELWNRADLRLVHVGKIGGPASLKLQLDILTTQTDAHFCYLAEDDYYYTPNALFELYSTMIIKARFDFMTPYDHPDNHNIAYQQVSNDIFYQGAHRWTSRTSTTHTFMCRRAALIDCRNVFRKPMLSKIDADTSHWMAITKANLLWPPFGNRYWLFCFVFTWLFRWPRILFGKRYRLGVPTPSMATHMAEGMLANGVNFELC
jgi:hypothetical protein